jgi:hypothetical protein
MSRVFVLQRTERPGGPLCLPAHTDYLDDILARTAARFLVIDPITAFLDRTVCLSNELSVRRTLDPLQAAAERRRCAALMHRHLNKYGTGRALYRGLGAIGLVGVCRTAFVAAPDPDNAERCVLAQQKNNVDVPQPSLAYATPREKGSPPAVTWFGTVPWTADELLARRRRPGPAVTELERARKFLASFLKDGPCPVRDVLAAADGDDLARRTLARARKALRIRRLRGAADGKPLHYWLLPGQDLPADKQEVRGPAELEPWLGPLRARYERADPAK